jgi:hypothetical protein
MVAPAFSIGYLPAAAGLRCPAWGLRMTIIAEKPAEQPRVINWRYVRWLACETAIWAFIVTIFALWIYVGMASNAPYE